MTTRTTPSTWLLTTATAPWFTCRDCGEEIPTYALAAATPADPHTWLCMTCCAKHVRAADIAAYQRRKP
jgi:hypothetical protein